VYCSMHRFATFYELKDEYKNKRYFNESFGVREEPRSPGPLPKDGDRVWILALTGYDSRPFTFAELMYRALSPWCDPAYDHSKNWMADFENRENLIYRFASFVHLEQFLVENWFDFLEVHDAGEYKRSAPVFLEEYSYQWILTCFMIKSVHLVFDELDSNRDLLVDAVLYENYRLFAKDDPPSTMIEVTKDGCGEGYIDFRDVADHGMVYHVHKSLYDTVCEWFNVDIPYAYEG
jgi:hypothetical protein